MIKTVTDPDQSLKNLFGTMTGKSFYQRKKQLKSSGI